MEALIIILVVTVGYLTFHMNKSDSESSDKEFDRLKDRLDTALEESPYKLEPIVVTKRKTKKRTARKVVLKKPKVVKKKTVKKKVVKKRKVKK